MIPEVCGVCSFTEALEQAESNGIDLYANGAGETITFMASAGMQEVHSRFLLQGEPCRYADYGYVVTLLISIL